MYRNGNSTAASLASRAQRVLLSGTTAQLTVDAFAEQADKTDEDYRATGFQYGQQDSDAELDSQYEGESYKLGFDIPSEHRHVMQGMTEQQHKVRSSTSALTGCLLTHTALVTRI